MDKGAVSIPAPHHIFTLVIPKEQILKICCQISFILDNLTILSFTFSALQGLQIKIQNI